jgi:hypothetical protein
MEILMKLFSMNIYIYEIVDIFFSNKVFTFLDLDELGFFFDFFVDRFRCSEDGLFFDCFVGRFRCFEDGFFCFLALPLKES